MVEIEIRTPIYNEESGEIEMHALAVVRADGDSLTAVGDKSVVRSDSVVSVTTGKPLYPQDDPEEWARSLPDAYRSGDLVAVVIQDDNPPKLDEPAALGPEPAIPEPPLPVFDEDREATMH
jgi:hypothetical protein